MTRAHPRPPGSTAYTAVLALVLVVPCAALAQDGATKATPDQEREAQAERLRAEIANQIHLQANDLLDELVFSWMEAPPFGSPTPVVLADVVVPLSYGSGLEALIENHLAQLLVKNPNTNVRLAHCPSCHSLVVHSDAKATVIARGIDQPRALEKLRGTAGAEHALFLDFEAEGTELVLRARMTKLEQTLPIVFARTLSTRTSSAALLRAPGRLVSAEQARQEYVDVLDERGPFTIPVSIGLNGFAPPSDSAIQSPIPIPWLKIGAEYAITSARAWTGSLALGATFLPTLQTGAMAQARISRLLTGSSYSLTHPNAYLFVGTALTILQGQTANLFDVSPTDPGATDVFGPVSTYLTLQTGGEVRISRRIGLAVYIETMPTHYESDNIGNYLDQLGLELDDGWGPIQVNSIGAEVTFAF